MLTLKIARLSKNLTQEELSRKSGVSQQYISMLEAGKRTGSLTTIKKLAVSLSTSVDELIF